MSRTKNTYEMYTKVRSFDVPLKRLLNAFNPSLLTDDELRVILNGLMSIKLVSNRRGYTASREQIRVMERNINVIGTICKGLLKLERVVMSDSLLSMVIRRYEDLTLNLNKQIGYYKT